jgi:hypothetical protein
VFVAAIIDSDPHVASQIIGRGSGHVRYYNPMQGGPRLSDKTSISKTEHIDLNGEEPKTMGVFTQILTNLWKYL